MTNPRRNKETPPPKPEQVVPNHPTAEGAALACLMDFADLSGAPLTEAHFFTPANKTIFGIIKDLHEKGQPVSIMTVRVMLEAKGLLEQAGGDPSRYFDFGGGGNAVLDYYYHHLEDTRQNRDALLFINSHMEDLSKCRINAKDFVAQLQEVV
jgi:hypothetical protein